MVRIARVIAGLVVYAGFMAFIVSFSNAPTYEHLDPDAVLVKLSFSHAAARREPCRELTAEELAQLARNMRQPVACGRERVDLVVDLKLDGETLYAAEIAPSGLARDGEATVYEKFVVTAGSHVIDIAMRDSRRTSGFDHVGRHASELAPGQLVVIDFDETDGGFVFR